MPRVIFRTLTQACWLVLAVLVLVMPSHAQEIQISEISVKACKEASADGKQVKIKVTITLKKTGGGSITYKITDGSDASKTLFEATSQSAGDTLLEFSVNSADFSGTIHVEIKDAAGNVLVKSDLVSVSNCPETEGSDDPDDGGGHPGEGVSRLEKVVTTATLLMAAGATLLASLAALIATIAGFAAARLVLSLTRQSRRENRPERDE